MKTAKAALATLSCISGTTLRLDLFGEQMVK
jgi:hypothetical protein